MLRTSPVPLQRDRSAGTVTRIPFALGETEALFAMMGRSDKPGEGDVIGKTIMGLRLEADANICQAYVLTLMHAL